MGPRKKEKKTVPPTAGLRPEYRFLRNGEIKRKGDRFRNFDGRWKLITFVGEKYDPEQDEPVRRRIKSKSTKRRGGPDVQGE